MKYLCNVCNWVYDEELGDPDNGIAPGTKFEDLPDDFECPLCFVGKEDFSKIEQVVYNSNKPSHQEKEKYQKRINV